MEVWKYYLAENDQQLNRVLVIDGPDGEKIMKSGEYYAIHLNQWVPISPVEAVFYSRYVDTLKVRAFCTLNEMDFEKITNNCPPWDRA